MMIQTDSLLFENVLILLVIHILLIMFLVITCFLFPIVLLYLMCLLLLFISKNINEALDHPGWSQVMIVEVQALDHNSTWELGPLPPRKKKIECWWFYVIKVVPNGKVDSLKWLVVKGYTHIYDLDCSDTFSPMTIVCLLFVMITIHHLLLHQLGIKWFSSWISIKRKSTWSNLLILFLKGSLIWFVSHVTLSMVSSNPHVFGLENVATLFKPLG